VGFDLSGRGNVWLKLVGKKKEDISGKSANIAMSLAIIPAIVSTVLLALLLKVLNVTTVADALMTAGKDFPT
jgi:hypothetical protein